MKSKTTIKNTKAVEIAKTHHITYEEALKYIKNHHPEWDTFLFEKED